MLDLDLSVSDDLDLGALICEEILDKSFFPLSPMLSVVLSRSSVVGRLGNCPDKMPVRFLNISFLLLTLLSLNLYFWCWEAEALSGWNIHSIFLC